MTRRLRWGVLGCARIANAVIPAIQQSETGEVVAVASRSLDTARQTAGRFGIAHACESYEALIANPEIDAVYIPLPNHLHKEWTLRAASAGKHVLCEKPLALDEREAQEMVEACTAAGVVLAEAFMYRHHPRYDRVKEILASGEVGKVRGIHASFRFNIMNRGADIRFHRSMGGGALYDAGCYPIHVARMLLGQEPEAVTMQAFFSPDHDHVDLSGAGLLEFPDGISATFDYSFWSDQSQTVEIYGTDGSVTLTTSFVYRTPEEASIAVRSRGSRRVEAVPDVNQYTLQADEFGRAVLTGAPLRFPPADAVRNMRVIEACLRSARERTRVVLG